MTEAAVQVQRLSKKFRLYRERNLTLKAAIMRGRTSVHEDFWALRDVSFDVPFGSSLGIIGRNGSGKSTLLKCLTRIYFPDEGTITSRGRVAALLEVGTGFHPELTGRENVYLNGTILGMRRKEVDAKFDEIVDFAGVETFIDQPVKTYSSGMYVRLGFSVAIHVKPDILIIDEVLAVGDQSFQEKCIEKFAELKADGRTLVLVSHALTAVGEMCDRAVWLDGGRLKHIGDSASTIAAYQKSEDGQPSGDAW